MKYLRIAVVVFVMILSNGCNVNSTTPSPIENSNIEQDKVCRETIQKLYEIETYCPNNLEARQNLFTDSFNKNYPPSLKICQDIQSYKIVKMLSSDDPNFPLRPNHKKPSDSLEYFLEIEIKSQPGKPFGGSGPSYAWIQMKINEVGECKVDDISGGG